MKKVLGIISFYLYELGVILSAMCIADDFNYHFAMAAAICFFSSTTIVLYYLNHEIL